MNRIGILLAHRHFRHTLVAAGLLARLVSIPLVGDRDIPYEWGTLARSLVAGRGYSYFSVNGNGQVVVGYLGSSVGAGLPSAYMPPLYAFGMAALLKVCGSEMVAATIAATFQAFLGAATAWLAYRAARVLFDERAAVWALGLYCFFPLAVYSTAQVSAVTLYVFLSQVIITYLLEWRQEKVLRPLRLLIAGSAAGFLLLARGEAMVVIVVILAWILLAGRSSGDNTASLGGARSAIFSRSRLAACAWFILPAVVVAAPWEIRNYVVFQQPTPLTISAGYNLWEGQNPNATGIHGGSVLPPVTEEEGLKALLGAIPGTNRYEVVRDSTYLQSALDAVAADPMRAAGLGLRKAFMYWTNLYPGVPINYPGAQSPAVVAPWLFVLLMAIVGFWVSLRHWRRAVLIHAYLMANTLVIMAFFVMPRYNLTVLPCVVLFAGKGLAWLAERLRLRLSTRVRVTAPRHERPKNV